MPRKKIPNLTGSESNTPMVAALTTLRQEKAEIAQALGLCPTPTPFVGLEAKLYASMSEMLPEIIEMVVAELNAKNGQVTAINILTLLGKAAPIFLNAILDGIEGARACTV